MDRKNINTIRTCLKMMRAFTKDERLLEDINNTIKEFGDGDKYLSSQNGNDSKDSLGKTIVRYRLEYTMFYHNEMQSRQKTFRSIDDLKVFLGEIKKEKSYVKCDRFVRLNILEKEFEIS